MNKNMLKILIATIILLIGIGAVSAFETNSTSDSTYDNNVFTDTCDNYDELSVKNNQNEVIAQDNDDKPLPIDNNQEEVIAQDNNDELLSLEKNTADITEADDNNKEVLSVENNIRDEVSIYNNGDEILTQDNENEKLTSGSDSPVNQTTQGKTVYKTFLLGKLKLPKKYKKFDDGYKPSKKNKKAWKKYKAYKKLTKKAMKKFKKKALKVIKKAYKNHWTFIDGAAKMKTKKTSKYYVYKIYNTAYKIYP